MTVSALVCKGAVESRSNGDGPLAAELAGLRQRPHLGIGEVEVPVGAVMVSLIDGRGGVAAGRIDLPLGHESGVHEIAEDIVGARPRRRKIDQGRVFRRSLEETRQHRRLRQIDVAGRLAEIGLRGGLHAEGAGAHIGAIEIELQDLLLGQMMFEPQRKIGFLDLALDRSLVGEEEVLRQLLGDRGAALNNALGLGVDGQRADGADDVDAEVAEEAPVLRRQHGLDEIVGQFLERNRIVVLDAALADLGAKAILKRHREVAALEPVGVGSLLKCGDGERERHEEGGKAERQPLAGEFDQDAQTARQMQTVGGGVDAAPGAR